MTVKYTIHRLIINLLYVLGISVYTHDYILAHPLPILDSANVQEKFFIDQQTAPVIIKKTLTLLNTKVPSATTTTLSWLPEQSLAGLYQPTPVLLVNGKKTGPTLCLTAAIHGDELNGIEIVRRILYGIEPETLSGAIIGVPIVNLQGFQRASRYLVDRRDLNRFFPGTPHGSSASRIAYSFFNEVIQHCNFLIDLHTGSAQRTNLPQIRADLSNTAVLSFVKEFDDTVILHSSGKKGTLRRAATEAGIPAVTLEAGKSLSLQESAINHGVSSIQKLIKQLNMLEHTTSIHNNLSTIYHHSSWVRVNFGGLLFSSVELGDHVTKNQILGTVTDPITNIRKNIISPYNGRVIGKAVNRVVMPGFAGFHVGIKQADKQDNLSHQKSKQPINF